MYSSLYLAITRLVLVLVGSCSPPFVAQQKRPEGTRERPRGLVASRRRGGICSSYSRGVAAASSGTGARARCDSIDLSGARRPGPTRLSGQRAKESEMARPRSSAAPATRRPAQVQSNDRATSSVAARRAVLKQIEDEGIEHVLFWFTDIEGHLKSFAITPDEMRGRARRRDGLRRLVDHRLQPDRGVRHGRDPRPGDVPDHAAAVDDHGTAGRRSAA